VKNVLAVDSFDRKDVFLTNELGVSLLAKQAKMTPEAVSKFADVDLNNIIPKRARVTAQVKMVEQPDELPEQSAPTPRMKPKKEKLSTVKESIDESTPTLKLRAPTKSLVAEVINPELTDEDEVPEEKIEKEIRSASTDKRLGPLPKEGSGLFQGIAFLLTASDGNLNDPDPDGKNGTVPFDVAYLSRQIEQGGGRIYQSFEEAQESADCNEIVLIACTYLRTVKYMQCLASGIPRIKHTWIIDCCKESTLLDKDQYLLPSGFSTIKNALHTQRTFPSESQIFKDMRFLLVTKNTKHTESWTPVLNAANAIIVDSMPTSSGTATRKASNSVDVIITDSSCPANIVKKAKQLRIPMVSSEYIVQSLINGQRLPYDAHEKFNYIYK
jgi:hypothetical protein